MHSPVHSGVRLPRDRRTRGGRNRLGLTDEYRQRIDEVEQVVDARLAFVGRDAVRFAGDTEVLASPS